MAEIGMWLSLLLIQVGTGSKFCPVDRSKIESGDDKAILQNPVTKSQ